jgi:hypothetical protein
MNQQNSLAYNTLPSSSVFLREKKKILALALKMQELPVF